MSPEFCVILPTFNNATTLKKVLDDVLSMTTDIIVVNDGSTDHTEEILSSYTGIHLLSYSKNKGKGYALFFGLQKALSLGYSYGITMDTDGQHFAEDIALFQNTIKDHPGALLIGSRSFHHENMPGGNSFANRFSNFWFRLQTSRKLPDTQSGFRMYPLKKIEKMRLFSKRYEAELELLVRLAWKDVPVIPVDIRVYYAPGEERVTHFRPFTDFFRISILNTLLTFAAFFYFYPKKAWKRILAP